MNDRVVKGVVVDAGHGGSDPGAVSGGLREKDFTLQAALYMYDRLTELGIPAVLTRSEDETLTRNERVNSALNAFGKDSDVILVSNHINAGGGEGAEVVYALRNDDTLAKSILENIGNAGQKTRKYYQRRLPENSSKDYYYILRLTDPLESVLVEYGFIDNRADALKLQNNLNDYVEGVVKAIASYLNVPYTPLGSNNNSGTGSTYTVQRGDTLYSIARKFNTSVDELKRLNNLNSNTLYVGQELIVKETPSSDLDNFITYTVKRGDSLWKIANDYNVSVSDLISFNNLSNTTLTIGQTLLIPKIDSSTPTLPDNTTTTYTVVKGDSLFSIAKEFNTSVKALKELNNLTSNLLTIGQQILVPTNDKREIKEFVYTVQSGDNLYKIALENDITIEEVVSRNNLETTLLSVGQQLIIPKNS